MKKISLIVVAVLSIFCCSCDLDKLDTTASRVTTSIRVIRTKGRLVRSGPAVLYCDPVNSECP